MKNTDTQSLTTWDEQSDTPPKKSPKRKLKHRDDQRSSISSSKSGKKRKAGPFVWVEPLNQECRLYRHVPSVRDADIPEWDTLGSNHSRRLRAYMIFNTLSRRQRTKARWYFPMDVPVLREAILQAKQEEEGDDHHRRKQVESKWSFWSIEQPSSGKTQRHKNSTSNQIPESTILSRDYGMGPFSRRPGAVLQTRDWNRADPFNFSDNGDNDHFWNTRLHRAVDNGRHTMLQGDSDDDNDFLGSDHKTKKHRQNIVLAHRKFDNPYVPAQWRLQQNKMKLDHPIPTVNEARLEHAQFFTQQRLNCADPAYLAPTPLSALNAIIDADMTVDPDHERISNTKTYEKATKHEIRPSKDDDNLLQYGNCLLCIPCPCPVCENNYESANTRNWCLIHPTGELLDTVAASSLKPPHGTERATIPRTPHNLFLQAELHRATTVTFNELNVGDTIRQIVRCGDSSHVYIARTSIHITIFSLTAVQDDTLPMKNTKIRNSVTSFVGNLNADNMCWGTFELKELHRIDLRSLGNRNKQFPLYFPASVTCHPTYGIGTTTSAGTGLASYQHKFAILSHSMHERESNVVHHILWSSPSDNDGTPTFHVTKHVFANLHVIADICFTSRHPMILWAIAKSYVRPHITPDRAGRVNYVQPRLGDGYALYTLDLRNNECAYQWSPSSQEFLVEGVHSISGVAVEPKESKYPNHVWVSSISAGKVWELDGTLFPLRVVNTWSLPNYCDEATTTTMPRFNGLYGCGTIFAHPISSDSRVFEEKSQADQGVLPMFCIHKSPNSFGVHIYQRPLGRPRFQTDPMECSTTFGLTSIAGKKHRFATSAILPTADGQQKRCTTGLVAICLPITSFFADNQDELDFLKKVDRGSSCLFCVVRLDNQGNLFAHTLLATRRERPGACKNTGDIIRAQNQVGFVTCDLQVSDKEKHGCSSDWTLAGGLDLGLGLADVPENKSSVIATSGCVMDELNSSMRPFLCTSVSKLLKAVRGEGSYSLRGDIHEENYPTGNETDFVAITDYREKQSSGFPRFVEPSICGNADTTISRAQFFDVNYEERTALDGVDTPGDAHIRSDMNYDTLKYAEKSWS